MSNRLVRFAFFVGSCAVACALVALLLERSYEFRHIVDQYPSISILGALSLWVYGLCTFVLWIKSWELVFPGKSLGPGTGPIVWFFLLIFGFYLTPWYICGRAIKEGAV